MITEEEIDFIHGYMEQEHLRLKDEMENPDNWKNKKLHEKISVMEEIGGKKGDK